MITVAEARARLLDLVAPLPVEQVALQDAAGRVLARPVAARRDQPPFAASAMDGYAIKATEAERHAQFRIIGESAAGHRFEGEVGPGQTVRIFTGAPVPKGADFVVIQENVSRTGDLITIADDPGKAANIRPAGADFLAGSTVCAPLLISASDLALLAAMNIASVPVTRRPVVALISTGDELVMPGDAPGPDQIIASNTFGLKAMFQTAGAQVRVLPIARDTMSSLRMALDLTEGADLVITIGGASVGDHDLVAKAVAELGMEQSFYKVAMRPGKPLMAGRIAGTPMVGLPGNPVSAMVCGTVFILPMLRRMQGLDPEPVTMMQAEVTLPLTTNGPREHYMRAIVRNGKITPFERQDSALLTVLAQANALLVRAPRAAACESGDLVQYLPL